MTRWRSCGHKFSLQSTRATTYVPSRFGPAIRSRSAQPLAALACWRRAGPRSAAAIRVAPCRRRGLSSAATLAVPLDPPGRRRHGHARSRVPAAPTRRTAVRRARRRPGTGGAAVAAYFAEVLRAAMADRDLLLFDQRGTGTSGALQLHGAEPAAARSSTRVRALRQRLGPRPLLADRRQRRRHRGAARAGGYAKLVALRRQLRHQGRGGLRGGVPEERRGARPRQRRAAGAPGSVPALDVEASPRVLRELCAGGRAGRHRRVQSDLARLGAGCASGALRGTVVRRRASRPASRWARATCWHPARRRPQPDAARRAARLDARRAARRRRAAAAARCAL